MILRRLKSHGLYLIFLSMLTLMFLAEKSFLLVPFMQYGFIILYALSLLLTLLITVLFGNKDKPFHQQYYQSYQKTVFIFTCIVVVAFWIASIYATFMMFQAKNQIYLIFMWLATVINTFGLWYHRKVVINYEKNNLEIAYEIITFLVTLLLIVITIVVTYNYPHMMIYRFLISLVITIIYSVGVIFAPKQIKGELLNENL